MEVQHLIKCHMHVSAMFHSHSYKGRIPPVSVKGEGRLKKGEMWMECELGLIWICSPQLEQAPWYRIKDLNNDGIARKYRQSFMIDSISEQPMEIKANWLLGDCWISVTCSYWICLLQQLVTHLFWARQREMTLVICTTLLSKAGSNALYCKHIPASSNNLDSP